MKKNLNVKYKRELINNGYTVVKNVLSIKECDGLKKIYKKVFNKFKNKTKVSNPLEEAIYNLHNKNLKFIKFIDHYKIINIVKYALSVGSYGKNEHIMLRQSALRNPKKGFAQQLHNDTRISGCVNPMVIQAIWMLDNFTKENGATRVVPKSHKLNKFPKNLKKYKNEKIITGKKGSVILINASTWHGSSFKNNNEDRLGMIFSYARWFLKPSFDQTKNTPMNIYKKLNSFQKELLGFKFNPPIDEFARSSSRASRPEKPSKYNI